MDGAGSEDVAAAREADSPGSRRRAFWRGLRETPVIPAAILALSFVGFGALTRETGLSLLHMLFMSVFIFALPGQVVLVDEMARGASMLTAGLAVTATAMRLLPMTVALLPVIRDRAGPKWLEALASYFIAITVWVEAMRRAPQQPRRERAAYTLGIAALLLASSTTGGTVGFLLAASVPTTIAAALLLLTPMYFLFSMLAGARTRLDILPILAGLVLGPLLHLALPQFDLLLTGLIGGTASFLVVRRLRGRAGT
jgi:predicted branched-subunit amino acid permease